MKVVAVPDTILTEPGVLVCVDGSYEFLLALRVLAEVFGHSREYTAHNEVVVRSRLGVGDN